VFSFADLHAKPNWSYDIALNSDCLQIAQARNYLRTGYQDITEGRLRAEASLNCRSVSSPVNLALLSFRSGTHMRTLNSRELAAALAAVQT